MKKRILVIGMLIAIMFVLAGCTQSEVVTHNLRKEAEEFNIRRRITALNTRTDKPLMQITGLLSIDVDSDGDLNITVEKAPGQYILNYVHLSQDTTYLVEQIETTEVNKYKYEIILYPQRLISGWIDYKISD